MLAAMASEDFSSTSATGALNGFYDAVGFDPLAREQEDASTGVNQIPREAVSDKDSIWYSSKRGSHNYPGQRTR